MLWRYRRRMKRDKEKIRKVIVRSKQERTSLIRRKEINENWYKRKRRIVR